MQSKFSLSSGEITDIINALHKQETAADFNEDYLLAAYYSHLALQFKKLNEHSEHYYDYDRNDIKRENPFVSDQWSLSVDSNVLSGGCYINLPDDLLKKANLKKGDMIEWKDQGDGFYLLAKVTDKTNNNPSK